MEPTQPEGAPTDAFTPPPPAVGSRAIRLSVVEKVKNLSGGIRDNVVLMLAHAEVEKRTTLVHAALTEIDKLSKELNGIRPTELFNASGEKLSGTFTKEQIDQRNKVTDRIQKIDRAIETALTTSDYGPLQGCDIKLS